MKIIKLNIDIFLLTSFIFLPSFLYGGNNISSFILSNLLFYIFFISRFQILDSTYLSEYKSIFISHIIFISFLLFQIFPNFEFFFKIFSYSHYELYHQLIGLYFRPISLHPFASFQFLNIIFNLFLIYLFVPQIIKSKRNLNLIFQMIIVIGFIHVIFGLFVEIFNLHQKLFFYEKNFYINSLTGFFINRNNFSYFLLIIFIINFYYLGFYKKYFLNSKPNISYFFKFISSNLIIYRISLIFISVGIILTKSRAGNLSFMMILFSIIIFEYLRHKKLTFNIILVITVLLLDLFIISNILGLEGLLDRVAASSIDGEASRLNVFVIGLKEFLNFPIFGYGYGGFEVLYRLNHDIYPTFYNHVHNDFIQFLGEFGIAGLFLFSFWIFRIIQNFKRNFNKNIYELNMIIILTLLITFIHGNLDFALHIPGNIYLLFFILSLSLTEIKRSIKN